MDTAVPFLAPYDLLSGYGRAMAKQCQNHVQPELILTEHDVRNGLFGRVSLAV